MMGIAGRPPVLPAPAGGGPWSARPSLGDADGKEEEEEEKTYCSNLTSAVMPQRMAGCRSVSSTVTS
jgi:hypothetical protein